MRVGGLIAAVAMLCPVAMLGLPVSTAWAQPPVPETLCRVTDPRLSELSGLVSDGKRWYGINDGGTKVQVFVLGRDCSVQKVITNALDPFDVEDLARSADGTLWLSDTGDNKKSRETVALLTVTPQGGTTLYRLSYPDGQHDTEALLLDRSGIPFLVTKDVLGDAKIYRPAGPLSSPGPTPLEKVGSLRIGSTDTPGGPVGAIGSVLVTGAASSADGKVLALRTYTDAYLYPSPDGDVLSALRRSPVRVPLPGEKQGEAIAFEPDGTLLSGSEGVGQPIHAVREATSLVASADASPTIPSTQGRPAGASSNVGNTTGSGDGASPPVLTTVAIALVLAGGGWFGISRLRRRR